MPSSELHLEVSPKDLTAIFPDATRKFTVPWPVRIVFSCSQQSTGNCGLYLVSGFTATVNAPFDGPLSDAGKAALGRKTAEWGGYSYGQGKTYYPEFYKRIVVPNEDKIFGPVAESLGKMQVAGFFISDNIATVRSDGANNEKLKASSFVRWLINKKMGTVCCLPISVNPVHKTKESLSLIQPWYWIPPDKMRYATQRGYRSFGRTRLQKEEDFFKEWSEVIPEEAITDFRSWRGK